MWVNESVFITLIVQQFKRWSAAYRIIPSLTHLLALKKTSIRAIATYIDKQLLEK